MKKKPKKPSRKVVLIEVETTLSNTGLRDYVSENLHDLLLGDNGDDWVCLIQVHVNAAKKERTK